MKRPRAYGISASLSATQKAGLSGAGRVALVAGTLTLSGAAGCFNMEIPDYDDGDVVLPGPETPLTDVVTPDAAGTDASEDAPSDITSTDANDSGDTTGRDTVAATPTLSELDAQLFQVSCTPCHTDRVSGGLSLRTSDQLQSVLLSASVQLPAMPRVTPGDPDQSYLWLKVTGAHVEAGGLGEPMPLGETLTRAQLDLLRRWIEDGAGGEPSVVP